MRTAQIAAGSTRQYFTFYIVGGILYLVLTGMSNQVFSLGYLWMLWDDDKQTWHDKMVRSIVVKA